MIQLTRNGMRGRVDIEALREEFASTHAVRLPQLLSADIMLRILDRMEHGSWIENIHPGISRELILDDQQAWQLLHFITSTPDFLSVIRQITGCSAVASFEGRMYRMLPGVDHKDSWHSDMTSAEDRLVGMSINLSPRSYSGGVFQLRRHDSEELLCELPNVISSDAILFRISAELKHRVTPVEGLEPKTAFAGWFMSSGTDFYTAIRQLASDPESA